MVIIDMISISMGMNITLIMKKQRTHYFIGNLNALAAFLSFLHLQIPTVNIPPIVNYSIDSHPKIAAFMTKDNSFLEGDDTRNVPES